MPSKPPFFIVGAPGSGTTLLRAMVSSHKNLAIPPEYYVLPSLVMRFGHGPHSPHRTQKIIQALRNADLFPNLQITDREYAHLFEQVPHPTTGQLYALVMQYWAQRSGAVRWGDKVPKHVFFIDVILQSFPDAKIIHLIRDGRGSIRSQKRRWNTPLPIACLAWSASVKAGNYWKRALESRGQYLEMSYEDLVQNPERNMRILCTFLDEPYDQNMITFNADIPSGEVANNFTPHRIEAWKHELSKKHITFIESFVGNTLLQAGYQLSAPYKKSRAIHWIIASAIGEKLFFIPPLLWQRVFVCWLAQKISPLRQL